MTKKLDTFIYELKIEYSHLNTLITYLESLKDIELPFDNIKELISLDIKEEQIIHMVSSYVNEIGQTKKDKNYHLLLNIKILIQSLGKQVVIKLLNENIGALKNINHQKFNNIRNIVMNFKFALKNKISESDIDKVILYFLNNYQHKLKISNFPNFEFPDINWLRCYQLAYQYCQLSLNNQLDNEGNKKFEQIYYISLINFCFMTDENKKEFIKKEIGINLLQQKQAFEYDDLQKAQAPGDKKQIVQAAKLGVCLSDSCNVEEILAESCLVRKASESNGEVKGQEYENISSLRRTASFVECFKKNIDESVLRRTSCDYAVEIKQDADFVKKLKIKCKDYNQEEQKSNWGCIIS